MRRALLLALVAGLAAVGLNPTAAGAATERRCYTGTIDGAGFRAEVPRRWNGTLVLFSHGYYPAGFGIPEGVFLANRL